MLRNCDYILAGTVIKQKYYNMNKGSEFNRLIDQYMEDPGFANAVKLIEYNEMTVFYFTESCQEGLYARKSLQDPKPEELPSAAEEQAEGRTRVREPRAEAAAAGKAARSSAPAPAPAEEPAAVRSAPVRVAPFGSSGGDAAVPARTAAMPSGGIPAPRAVQPVARQSILAAATAKAAEAQNKRDANAAESGARERDNVASAAAARQGDAAEPAPREVVARAEPARAEAAPAAAAAPAQTPARATAPAAADAIAAAEPAPVRAAASAPAAAQTVAAPPAPAPSYPNVVATLRSDIETMIKQLDHYRKQLPYRPLEADKLKAWCESLEAAIREFTRAVNKLEGK